MSPQLLFLVVVALLQICTLVLVEVNAKSPLETGSRLAALKKVDKVYSILTSMKWNVDMVLTGDNGRVNLSQKECLHQVSSSCTEAARELEKLLNELQYTLTSKNLESGKPD